MEIKELLEVSPGNVLVVCGIERKVAEVLRYTAKTSTWTNLVSLADTGREVVLEITAEEVRIYLEMSDLPLNAETMKPVADIGVDVIIVHESRRFEKDEGPSRAKTQSFTKEGIKPGEVRFAVFTPEDDEESEELVAVEERNGRLVAYHSSGLVPLEDIQLK